MYACTFYTIKANERKSIALITFEIHAELYYPKIEKSNVKFQFNLFDNFSGKVKRGRAWRIFASEFWMRINNISPLRRARRDKQRCRNYTVTNPDKNLDRFSHVSVSGTSKKRRSTTNGKRVRKRMYGRTKGRTDGLKNAHVPPLCSPRSRYRPAKYCYRSARRWITDARAQRPAWPSSERRDR